MSAWDDVDKPPAKKSAWDSVDMGQSQETGKRFDTAGDSAFKNTTSHASITATQQQVVNQPQIATQATHAASTTPAVLSLIGVIAVMLVFWFIQKSKKTVLPVCHVQTDFDTLAKDALTTSDLNVHYKTLGLDVGVSATELQERVKELVRQWHPDQFQGQPEKYQLATSKLQSFRSAYEAITQAQASNSSIPASAAGQSTSSLQPHEHKGREWAAYAFWLIMFGGVFKILGGMGGHDPGGNAAMALVIMVVSLAVFCPIAYFAGRFKKG